MYFAYFQDLRIKVPTNCENYMKPVGACGNYTSKCEDTSENMYSGFEQKLYIQAWKSR